MNICAIFEIITNKRKKLPKCSDQRPRFGTGYLIERFRFVPLHWTMFHGFRCPEPKRLGQQLHVPRLPNSNHCHFFRCTAFEWTWRISWSQSQDAHWFLCWEYLQFFDWLKTCVRHGFIWLFTANSQENEMASTSSQVVAHQLDRNTVTYATVYLRRLLYTTRQAKRGQLFWPVCTSFRCIRTFYLHPKFTKWV